MIKTSSYNGSYQSELIKAVNDVYLSILQWRFAWRLASHEMRRRYRRTIIGPFWTTLSMAIFVFSLGSVFSFVWHQDVSKYIPYVTSGYIAWMPIAGLLGESIGILAGSGDIIKQTPRPYTSFILTSIMGHFILFLHHMTVFVFVAIVFSVEVNFSVFLILPGLLLVLFNGIWASMLISIACARYRDIQPIISNLLMIALWLTPVFWPAENIRAQAGDFILDYNIFYHFVSIIREPLLGNTPDLLNYYVVAGTSIIGPIITILVFARYRRWIIYWL